MYPVSRTKITFIFCHWKHKTLHFQTTLSFLNVWEISKCFESKISRRKTYALNNFEEFGRHIDAHQVVCFLIFNQIKISSYRQPFFQVCI